MTRHLALFCFIIACYLPSAEAGKVVKIKDKKVYIVFDSTEGGTFAENDFFTLTDDTGKKKGLVQLKKVKGLKAIGLLKKGKADKGYGTLFKSPGKTKKKSTSLADDSSEETAPTSTLNIKRTRWGGMFGYGLASQEVADVQGTPASTSGSSMAIKFVYDMPLLETIAFRAMAGAELFAVSGTHSIIGATNTDITYLTLDPLIKWSFMQTQSMNFYLIGGGALLYPMSKSSNVIVEDTIESLMIGEFGAGLEFTWGTWLIPLELSYYYFPSGEDVTTSVISFKTGILF